MTNSKSGGPSAHPPLWWVALCAVGAFIAFIAYGLAFGVVRVTIGPSVLPSWPLVAFQIVFFVGLGVLVTTAFFADRA